MSVRHGQGHPQFSDTVRCHTKRPENRNACSDPGARRSETRATKSRSLIHLATSAPVSSDTTSLHIRLNASRRCSPAPSPAKCGAVSLHGVTGNSNMPLGVRICPLILLPTSNAKGRSCLPDAAVGGRPPKTGAMTGNRRAPVPRRPRLPARRDELADAGIDRHTQSSLPSWPPTDSLTDRMAMLDFITACLSMPYQA